MVLSFFNQKLNDPTVPFGACTLSLRQITRLVPYFQDRQLEIYSRFERDDVNSSLFPSSLFLSIGKKTMINLSHKGIQVDAKLRIVLEPDAWNIGGIYEKVGNLYQKKDTSFGLIGEDKVHFQIRRCGWHNNWAIVAAVVVEKHEIRDKANRPEWRATGRIITLWTSSVTSLPIPPPTGWLLPFRYDVSVPLPSNKPLVQYSISGDSFVDL